MGTLLRTHFPDIHGYRCKGCDRLMSEEYGEVANTLIEVHHVTPVHALGPSYAINPKTDLIPLCPNCHSVAHVRNPPLTLEEIRAARKAGTVG
jgi:5-methylcytosine-specific restriction enzyme A